MSRDLHLAVPLGEVFSGQPCQLIKLALMRAVERDG